MHTSTFWLKFGSLSSTVTLKSRSPKPNQLFIMSQCYIHVNLVKIHPPAQEILCKQEHVMLTLTLMPMPTGSAPKTICPHPPPSRKLLCIKVTPDLHLSYSKNGGNLGLVLKMKNIACISILLTKHVKYTYLYLFKFVLSVLNHLKRINKLNGHKTVV